MAKKKRKGQRNRGPGKPATASRDSDGELSTDDVRDSDHQVRNSDKRVRDSDKRGRDTNKRDGDNDVRVSDKRVRDSDSDDRDFDGNVRDSDDSVRDADGNVRDSDSDDRDSDSDDDAVNERRSDRLGKRANRKRDASGVSSDETVRDSSGKVIDPDDNIDPFPSNDRSTKPARMLTRAERRAVERQKHAARAKPRPDAQVPKAWISTNRGEPSGPARDPKFWFGFEVSWAKLTIARFVIFGMLAVDAFMQISHAPRYGASDFNVGNVAWLGWLSPGRIGYEVAQLGISYLLVFAAFGLAVRWVLPVAATLYAWLYFSSQLDSYQHHYLVALVLGIACFVPWQRPPDAKSDAMVRSWAVRLLLVQIAIMYLWAAISKLDAFWFDGTTLGRQLTGSIRSMIDRTVGIQVASTLVVATEVMLAATIWNKRTWFYAAPMGILFHLGILATGFEIGLFAYLMLAFYIFIVPDLVWTYLAEVAGEWPRKIAGWGNRKHLVAWAGAIVFAGSVAIMNDVPHTFEVLCVLLAIPLGDAIMTWRRGQLPRLAMPLAQLAAVLLWLAVDRKADVGVEYYRFWGGATRRLGNYEEAETAYRGLIRVAPSESGGHYHLGRILLMDKNPRVEEGLAEIHEAQRIETTYARSWTVEARWLAAHGKRDEAIAKARRGVTVEPSDREARQFLKSLLESKPDIPATGDTDD